VQLLQIAVALGSPEQVLLQLDGGEVGMGVFSRGLDVFVGAIYLVGTTVKVGVSVGGLVSVNVSEGVMVIVKVSEGVRVTVSVRGKGMEGVRVNGLMIFGVLDEVKGSVGTAVNNLVGCLTGVTGCW
jgi:hypothetical protein